MSVLHRLIAAAPCLLLMACASPRTGAAPSPPREAASPAATLLAGCADPTAGGMTCRERALLEVLEGEGVAAAMRTLEGMAELSEEIRRDGHVYAHAIGLAAYTGAAEVGAVFARCSPAFQSGCYHGVIQSYFAELAGPVGAGITPEAVNGLCAEQRGDQEKRWLLFQCAHGIGHGVTSLRGHDLRRALGDCDLIRDDWEREACFGGAFMESLVQATAPHHTVGRPQHAGGGEHDHHAGHAEPAFRPLDPAEPLYPCTVLEERYLTSCYQMQTSAVLFFNGGDFAAAAAACDTAPERYRPTCYQSLGRDVSSYTGQNHREAQRLCRLGSALYRVQCHVGYVKNVIDITARPADGIAFCRTLPDADAKLGCYRAVGEQIAVLAATPPRRRALCEAAEAGYVDACSRGAGVD